MQRTFAKLDWTEEFNGIWACASLLHLPKNELENVLETLLKALKASGVMYVSFKAGTGEAMEKGRFFSYYNENELKSILQKVGSNEVVKCWTSEDVRRSRQKQSWTNCLAKKIN